MATIDVRLVSSVDIRNLEAGEAVRFSHAEKFPISGPLSTFQHTVVRADLSSFSEAGRERNT